MIGWPLTYPAAPVSGYLVSDRFHAMTPAEIDLDGTAAVWPPSLVDLARHSLGAEAVPTRSPACGRGRPARQGLRRRQRPGARSPIACTARWRLARRYLDPVRGRSLSGLDAVGHYFLRFADPGPFGDVSDEERQRYGRLLEQCCRFIDTHVGHWLGRLGPDDVLLVASGFGMEPLSVGKRLLERVVGNPAISGTHERAPDGFLLAFGGPVQPGRPTRASVVDLAPTVLYFFGLPVGRDMDGFARTELFRAAFTAERPVTYIPGYGR